jgi:hypothetical protein
MLSVEWGSHAAGSAELSFNIQHSAFTIEHSVSAALLPNVEWGSHAAGSAELSFNIQHSTFTIEHSVSAGKDRP